MGLDRRHALIVVHDTEVSGVFKKECFSTWDEGWCAPCCSSSLTLAGHGCMLSLLVAATARLFAVMLFLAAAW
jgi:hypothetical protein